MREKITAHVLACGTMHCDLTWLLLQPGTAITDKEYEFAIGELRVAPQGSYT